MAFRKELHYVSVFPKINQWTPLNYFFPLQTSLSFVCKHQFFSSLTSLNSLSDVRMDSNVISWLIWWTILHFLLNFIETCFQCASSFFLYFKKCKGKHHILCMMIFFFFQFNLVAQSWPTLCDPMDYTTPGLPIYHQLLESTQTHVYWDNDAIQSSHPLSSPSLAFNHSQHQVCFLFVCFLFLFLFKWVSSSHQMAKVLKFQLQYQSFQWTLRTDLL